MIFSAANKYPVELRFTNSVQSFPAHVMLACESENSIKSCKSGPRKSWGGDAANMRCENVNLFSRDSKFGYGNVSPAKDRTTGGVNSNPEV